MNTNVLAALPPDDARITAPTIGCRYTETIRAGIADEVARLENVAAAGLAGS